MKFHLGQFISYVFMKSRKRYRFTGIVIGHIAIGVTYATDRSARTIESTTPLLPFGDAL